MIKYTYCMLAFAVLLGAVNQLQAQEIETDTLYRHTDTLPVYTLPNYQQAYPVLYHKQSAGQLTGAIGYLKGEKLETTPSPFVNTALTGRIAGLYTHQASGEPGSDGVSLTLRGRSPLVLIDGVPRTLWSINPEQIASITVLKDALSTAMLGMRSMDGAVLITTKKGKRAPGFNIDVTAQSGVSAPVNLPDPLSAYDYAMLYNEALANEGKAPLYTQADLEAYKNHTDPYGHPDINWYNRILKDQTSFSRYTLNADGANKVMNYFVSLDYLKQNGLLRQSDLNSYSTNTEYQRYSFRSNVSVNLTSHLSMYLNLFGRMRSQNQPGSGTSSIIDALLNTPDNAYPALNPDSSLGGNINYNNNIYGQSVLSGYTHTRFSEGYFDLGVRQNMDDILKGWWIKGVLSYKLTLNQIIDRSKNFATFHMIVDPQTNDTSYQRYGTESDQRNNSSVTAREHKLYADVSTGYSHQWERSKLDAYLTYNVNSLVSNERLDNSFKTLAARIGYDIQGKYIFQAAASYSGNNLYQPGYLFGFFPAAGIAWNINKEDFFRKDGFINALKVRATYGLTGNAVPGYYEYIDHYVDATGYNFGSSAASYGGLTDYKPLAVTTWEKGLKLDIGLDMYFSGNRGALTVDYYRNRLSDLTQLRGESSALLGYGSDITRNLGKDLYSGLEITAGWSGRLNAFGYYISGNFSISNSKILFNDEPGYPYSWMQKTGRQVGEIYGYVADGFITQAGVGPVIEGYNALPGDIRYKDLNNDGVINQYDQKSIGNQKPLLFYGADLGFTWKHLSLSLLIQGVSNRDVIHTGPGQWAFQNGGKGQAWQYNLNRWTPETASAATYPRVSVGTNANNDVLSSFWVKSGNYLRLKNVQLKYSFDHLNIKGLDVHQADLFVNGLNLLTLATFKQSDPEVLNGSYPIQRIINGGITIKF